MTEYKVSWDMNLEAESPTDAMRQAIALLDDAINRNVGATGFIVHDWDTDHDYLIDIEGWDMTDGSEPNTTKAFT
jgi:hypothetical protein